MSGTPLHRPAGQQKAASGPTFAPCQNLDYEVEFAAFVGCGNERGSPIKIDDANDHVFGVVLMNDWSARDIQFWESTLGPFNGKNFCTTISPWVVTLEALDSFRTKPHNPVRYHYRRLSLPLFRRADLEQGSRLPYLTETRPSSVFDIPVQAILKGTV